MEQSEDVVKTRENEHEGKAPEAPTGFGSENDLCNHLIGMRVREIQGGIWLKWHAGNFIRGFYKAEKAYGKDELGKIARKTGWSKSSLQKACQFAEKYSIDQVDALSRGRFQLAWRDISQNLCLEAQAFIDAYSEAQTRKQFGNAVIQLRPALQDIPQSPKPKTHKELALELAERDKKIVDLESRIQELEAMTAYSTSSDELAEAEEIEAENDPVEGGIILDRWWGNLEELVAA
jgi:hypothetical protein